MRPLALSILVLVALIAPAASADVPAWVDGPSFRAFCDTLREKTACPGCSCEAMTQSPPTAGMDGASGFGTGLVVRLAGAQADGRINFDQLRVALGSEGKLVDAGVIGEASYPADGRTYGVVEVLESAQRVDAPAQVRSRIDNAVDRTTTGCKVKIGNLRYQHDDISVSEFPHA